MVWIAATAPEAVIAPQADPEVAAMSLIAVALV